MDKKDKLKKLLLTADTPFIITGECICCFLLNICFVILSETPKGRSRRIYYNRFLHFVHSDISEFTSVEMTAMIDM